MDNNNFSRVYINPNFNKGIGVKQHNITNTNVMHLNPNFSSTQNNKIYINPNFKPISQPLHNTEQCSNKTERIPSLTGEIMHHRSTAAPVPDSLLTQFQIPVTKNSRYHLVRHNENKPPETRSQKTETLTVKLSKYKSVRISDVKLNLDRVKQSPKEFNISNRPMQSSTHIYDQKLRENILSIPHNYKTSKTKYTFTKSKETTMNSSLKSKSQYSFIKSKDVAKKVHYNRHAATNTAPKPAKIKIRKLKIKCYTPCRLFRKYGKCIRNERGHCKYLHDEKHVSICRKFVKGICHDKNCLLSHELSDKKMPTCYFYLQGMCTKEGCPYVHVKVNEKAMVCPDFKKGYCEKGNKCLYRHVENVKKRKKKLKFNENKTKQLTLVRNLNVAKTQIMPPVTQDQASTSTDSRYYTEVIADTETSETYRMIKPTRCQLGTLPSFIKL